MSKLFVYVFTTWFALGSVMPGGDFMQVLKLSNLFKHYQDHRAEAEEEGIQEFDFFTFTAMHFGSSEHRDDHADDHEDLPFQGVTSVLLVVMPESGFILAPATDVRQKPPVTAKDFIPTDLIDGVFRPPLA